MPDATLAVIGGSGFYQIDGLSRIETVTVDTPFGPTSDAVTIGTLDGVRIAFLPRHGRGHRLLPTEIPARANIWALKSLGVQYLLSVSAVGSLRDEMAPGHAVVPDQFIDRTRLRPQTFFGEGLVAHVSLADPFCPALSRAAAEAAAGAGMSVHGGGTYLAIEGPQFSTRAESHLYRSWGADVIGMTASPELRLAREAEICYAVLATVTDYDCWRAEEAAVSAAMIVETLRRNVAAAREAVRQLAARLPARASCPCPDALATALITDRAAVPPATLERLHPIIGRHLA